MNLIKKKFLTRDNINEFLISAIHTDDVMDELHLEWKGEDFTAMNDYLTSIDTDDFAFEVEEKIGYEFISSGCRFLNNAGTLSNKNSYELKLSSY